MLNTKEMSANVGKVKPVISVGNNVVKINSIVLSKTPYDEEACNIHLNVETKPVDGDFVGFLKDPQDKDGERYKGQVGRVRISQYHFKDGFIEKSNTEISRDREILRSLVGLSEALGKRDDLDNIQANTIEEYVELASKTLCDDTYINVCVGGREWMNKDGYINYDLYLPKSTASAVAYESLDVEQSKLLQFDAEKHVRKYVEKKTESVNSFEPVSSNGTAGDDFDL